ncbi:MAG: hypothetical protein HZC41_05870 [Chloroflexi bacterium]|nr:hypothetical protein [Chloroflexota bacterium]
MFPKVSRILRRWPVVITLPRLLVGLALALTFSLFTVVQSVVAGSKLAAVEPDPGLFRPYQGVMPGRSSANLSRHLCNVSSLQPITMEVQFYCSRRSADTRLWLLGASVSNGVLMYVTFQFNEVQLGDLAREWGRPDVILKTQRVCLAEWRPGRYASLSPCSPSLFFATVKRVTITQP